MSKSQNQELWRCRACGNECPKEELTVTLRPGVLTCADYFCGGTADRVKQCPTCHVAGGHLYGCKDSPFQSPLGTYEER